MLNRGKNVIKPVFFDTPAALRRWFRRHHQDAAELWVGYYKMRSGRASVTWPESVDEALCFGWIDGVRKRLDEESYVIRFTPRRKGSIWSTVNTKRARQLIHEGRMQAAGLRAFEARDAKKTGAYSFEREQASLTLEQEAQFRRNPTAWEFFESQPPGYRKIAAFYVVSAKQEATRARRLQRLIDDSAAGRRIGILERDLPRSGRSPRLRP